MGPKDFDELHIILHSDIREEDEYFNAKPLLAHYTSLNVLELMLSSGEIWLSNPLFMNDSQEVGYGIVRGTQILASYAPLKVAFKSDDLHARFIQNLHFFVGYFEQQHLLDTYAFCMSLHDHADQDGLLSMWRGYGGNGRGAAIVIDSGKIPPLANSPLIISKVHYGSNQQREQWMVALAQKLADFLNSRSVGEVDIAQISSRVIDRLKLFSLFTKHKGFGEEREWRLVYMKDRDQDGLLTSRLSYSNGPRGVEPKLKLRLNAVPGLPPGTLTVDTLVAQILLGPSASSELTKRSIKRMLETIAPALTDRVTSSSIPYRGT